jgi:hypothetical protein
MLAAGNRDNAIREVNILPAKLVLFSPAHTSVKSQVEFRFTAWIEFSNPVVRQNSVPQ